MPDQLPVINHILTLVTVILRRTKSTDATPLSLASQMPTPVNSFVFDLDGTLVDSVYQHVLARQSALEAEGIEQLGGAAIAGLA
jgi:hypothetical protein